MNINMFCMIDATLKNNFLGSSPYVNNIFLRDSAAALVVVLKGKDMPRHDFGMLCCQ